MLQGFRNEELLLAFVFSTLAVIHDDCHFELFSAFSFLHAKVKTSGQEKKKP